MGPLVPVPVVVPALLLPALDVPPLLATPPIPVMPPVLATPPVLDRPPALVARPELVVPPAPVVPPVAAFPPLPVAPPRVVVPPVCWVRQCQEANPRSVSATTLAGELSSWVVEGLDGPQDTAAISAMPIARRVVCVIEPLLNAIVLLGSDRDHRWTQRAPNGMTSRTVLRGRQHTQRGEEKP